MKPAIFFAAAAAALAAASPALATGTVLCQSPQRPSMRLYLVVAYTPEPVISQANLVGGWAEFSTGAAASSPVVTQNWYDERELKLDIVDGNAESFVARLRTRRVRTGVYAGTLLLRGRTLRVTCRNEEE